MSCGALEIVELFKISLGQRSQRRQQDVMYAVSLSAGLEIWLNNPEGHCQ